MGLDTFALLAALQLPATSGGPALPSDAHLVISTRQPISIEYSLTGADSTPASVHFTMDIPTLASDQLPVREPLVNLVGEADAHIRAMAFLPGDPAADTLVERLRRTKYAEQKQPLARSRRG